MSSHPASRNLLRVAGVTALFLALAGPDGFAQDKLPGGVANRLKDVNAQLDRAQKALDQGGAKAAQRNLEAAQKGMDDIFKQYQGKFQEDHPEIVAAKSRIDATQAKVDAALAGEAGPDATKPPAGGDDGAKLPSAVTKRLADASRLLDRAEERLESGGESIQSLFGQVRQLLDEVEQNYCSQIDMGHPEIATVRDRLDALATSFDEKRQAREGADSAAEAAQAKDSAEWLGKLSPFADMASPMNLIAEDAPRAAFDRARQLIEAYRATEFAAGTSADVDRLAEQVERLVAEYPEKAKRRQDLLIGEAESRLTLEEENWLRWSEKWAKDDPTRLPPSMTPEQRTELEATVAWVAEVAPEDPRIEVLRGRLEVLRKEDAAREEKNLASKRMDGDQYPGDDAAALRQFAAEVVAKAFPDAKILRTTLPSKGWAEESVVEWTDTTQTALRHRVTRHLWAEIAVQEGEAAFVHGVYVGQDRASEGGWGPLQGHTTWKNRILLENVEK